MENFRKTLILKVQYDGSNYAGWQRQINAVAVQEVLEQALSKTFNRTMTAIGAGRTDAGVHARGQVTHSILREPSNIPDDKITKAINSNLPDDVCVSDGKIVDFKFHATADAIAREYSYSVHTKPSVFLRNYSNHFKFPIDFNKLQEVADIFTGIHDFTTFSKNNADTKSYICNVEFCYWENISDTQSILHIKADRFVYGMVRCLAGAMLDYARGARTLTELTESLEAKDRSLTSPLATPRGLVLERVSYRENVI
jgi:tRNA pseudouridine38-40 synthase